MSKYNALFESLETNVQPLILIPSATKDGPSVYDAKSRVVNVLDPR